MRKIYAPEEDGCDVDGKGKESDVCGTTRGWAWGRPDRAIRNWSTAHSNQYGTLNIHCCNLLKHHTRKIHKTAVVGGGIGAICDQVMECVCVQLTLVLMCGHLTEGQSALTSTISLTLHFRRQQDGPKICKTQQGRGYAPTCKKTSLQTSEIQ